MPSGSHDCQAQTNSAMEAVVTAVHMDASLPTVRRDDTVMLPLRPL
jgi:hypothetical protein